MGQYENGVADKNYMMNFGESRESEANQQRDNEIKDDEFMLFLAGRRKGYWVILLSQSRQLGKILEMRALSEKTVIHKK